LFESFLLPSLKKIVQLVCTIQFQQVRQNIGGKSCIALREDARGAGRQLIDETGASHAPLFGPVPDQALDFQPVQVTPDGRRADAQHVTEVAGRQTAVHLEQREDPLFRVLHCPLLA
jgi:hypothetical protein